MLELCKWAIFSLLLFFVNISRCVERPKLYIIFLIYANLFFIRYPVFLVHFCNVKSQRCNRI